MPAPFSSRPSRPRPRCCLPGPSAAPLRVALADSVCSTFLPDLLQQFHALCPQVELVLRTATADEMLRLLSANRIDLAYTLDQPLLLPSLTLAVNGRSRSASWPPPGIRWPTGLKCRWMFWPNRNFFSQSGA